MKQIVTLISLMMSITAYSQSPIDSTINTSIDTLIAVPTTQFDEGTNNPESTGSTKIIVNGIILYIKQENNIKIEHTSK